MLETIHWTLVESSQAPLENPEKFLSTSELQKLSAFRFAKRRQEWLLGRWAAKSLIRSLPAYHDYSLTEIEILSAAEGAPSFQMRGGGIAPNGLSISHCDQFALCALSSGTDVSIGIDMEKIEPRSHTFVKDYFTPLEVGLVIAQASESKDMLTTLIWSAKEAMLKALRVGLHWDTRQVEIYKVSGSLEASRGWNKIHVADLQRESRGWSGWWQQFGGYVITLAGFTQTGSGLRSAQLVEKRVAGV